jgi:hypothetical protein
VNKKSHSDFPTFVKQCRIRIWIAIKMESSRSGMKTIAIHNKARYGTVRYGTCIICKKSSVADPGCLSDPGSDFFPSQIPDPNCLHPRSASKNLSILTPKKWFLSSRKYYPGCSFQILDPDADFLSIPDPGSMGQKGTGSRIRIRNTGKIWRLFRRAPNLSNILEATEGPSSAQGSRNEETTSRPKSSPLLPDRVLVAAGKPSD